MPVPPQSCDVSMFEYLYVCMYRGLLGREVSMGSQQNVCRGRHRWLTCCEENSLRFCTAVAPPAGEVVGGIFFYFTVAARLQTLVNSSPHYYEVYGVSAIDSSCRFNWCNPRFDAVFCWRLPSDDVAAAFQKK